MMKKSFREKNRWTSTDKILVESNIDLQRSEALIFPEAWNRSLSWELDEAVWPIFGKYLTNHRCGWNQRGAGWGGVVTLWEESWERRFMTLTSGILHHSASDFSYVCVSPCLSANPMSWQERTHTPSSLSPHIHLGHAQQLWVKMELEK